MDLKNLSKQKYIYKLYEARDGLLHVEKFPIIYANKANVYYKSSRCSELSVVAFREILDDLQSTHNIANYRLQRGIYFWNDPSYNCESLITDIKKKNLERRMMEYGSWIYARHRDIERYEEEVNKIKKELEALE